MARRPGHRRAGRFRTKLRALEREERRQPRPQSIDDYVQRHECRWQRIASDVDRCVVCGAIRAD